MPTLKTAPATTAFNTADITVAATPINVGLFVAAGGAIPANVIAPITRKNSSGTYSPTGKALSGAEPSLSIVAPGVYRVEKPATDVAVGVDTD